jgi:hypothetical protein
VTVQTAPDKYGNFVLGNNLQVSSYFLPKDSYADVKVGDQYSEISGIFDIHYGKPTVHPVDVNDLVKK